MNKLVLIGVALAPLSGCGSSAPELIESKRMAYKHGTPPGPAPWSYYLTTFGGGSDTQGMACGGTADASWYYATGAYTFGCKSKLKLEANGKCVVVEVRDNGPAAWVEAKAAGKCGGTGYIIDASPLASKHLFGASGAGWSDCYEIKVTKVDKSTPNGPCTPSTTTGSCGNGTIEAGETCDPPSTCPTSCNDGSACTTDMLGGAAATCTATCQHHPILACISGDGCCAPGCSTATDSDCGGSSQAQCGNSLVEQGETCDPPSSCPTSCNDNVACTIDRLHGSPASCSARCEHVQITTCAGGDGCCPGGCAGTDPDCGGSQQCGNGNVDPGETCDPPSACPASCNDGNACTADTLAGSAATCNATCNHTPMTLCIPGDGCCPAGCAGADTDCVLPPTGGSSSSSGCALTRERDGIAPTSLLLLLCLFPALRRRRRR